MPQTVPEPRTSVRPDRCAAFQIQPQHDLGPNAIPPLATGTRPGHRLHLQVTSRNHQPSIDLQVIHAKLHRDYTRRLPKPHLKWCGHMQTRLI